MDGRRGQGLPLNTIIIAIIVIVVLVVIILIFTGQIKGFTSTASGGSTPCDTTSKQCVPQFQCSESGAPTTGCAPGLVCCPNTDLTGK